MNVVVDLGGALPLPLAVNAWAHDVLLYRDIALGKDGDNPFERTADDFVGTVYLRQAIQRCLESNELTDAYVPLLAVADVLHHEHTAPDPEGVLLELTSATEAELFRENPDWWWWHRIPTGGPIADEMRRIQS